MKTSITLLLTAALLFSVTAQARPVTGNTHQHAPGTLAHDDGNRAYRDGMYREALMKYVESAYWADKLSQYNLGVMHYHGEGVERDAAMAWAWFELAAERRYPQMVEAAEAVWKELDDDARERARGIHAELLPKYGDAVALERTAKVMEREWRNRTGTRVGADTGNLQVMDRTMPMGMSEPGHKFYAKERWDYDQIVAIEKQIFENLSRGRVEVGDLETIEQDEEPTPEP